MSEPTTTRPTLGNALIFPRDRWAGSAPDVPEADDLQVGAKVLAFAESIVRLTRLGVAPEHFRKAIEESPLREELQRAIGAELLKQSAAPKGLTTPRHQGLQLAGGPAPQEIQATIGGVPVLMKSCELLVRGMQDHTAKAELFIEPPQDLIFKVTGIEGLDRVASAWGYQLVRLMDKERAGVSLWPLWARLFNRDSRGRAEILVGPYSLFEKETGNEDSNIRAVVPIAGATVRIVVHELLSGALSWSLLGKDAAQLELRDADDLLRAEIPEKALHLVVGPLGYKLRKVNG